MFEAQDSPRRRTSRENGEKGTWWKSDSYKRDGCVFNFLCRLCPVRMLISFKATLFTSIHQPQRILLYKRSYELQRSVCYISHLITHYENTDLLWHEQFNFQSYQSIIMLLCAELAVVTYFSQNILQQILHCQLKCIFQQVSECYHFRKASTSLLLNLSVLETRGHTILIQRHLISATGSDLFPFYLKESCMFQQKTINLPNQSYHWGSTEVNPWPTRL